MVNAEAHQFDSLTRILSFTGVLWTKMNGLRTNNEDKLRWSRESSSHFCPDVKLFASFRHLFSSIHFCAVSECHGDRLSPAWNWLGFIHHKQDGSTRWTAFAGDAPPQKKKKSTVTPWQMFRSLHFLLISCYLLWNKHGGPRKANRPPVKNTSICISQHHKACQMAAPSRGKFPQTAVCSTQSGKRTFSGSQ